MGMLNYESVGVASCDIAEVLGVAALGRYALRFRLKMSVFDFSKHYAKPGYLVWFGGELDTPAGRAPLHPVLDYIGLQAQDRDLYIDALFDGEQIRLLDDARRTHHEELELTLHL